MSVYVKQIYVKRIINKRKKKKKLTTECYFYFSLNFWQVSNTISAHSLSINFISHNPP